MSTIYAFTHPFMKSAVAILRLSGEGCEQALRDLGCDSLPEEKKAVLRKLRAIKRGGADDIIDEALVIRFKGPHSFTGEDVVELHMHGSIAVMKDMVSYLASLPYLEAAQPGAFTRLAFENGKMDLTRVEGLADLIDAQTTMQQKQALRLMQGEQEQLYSAWREQLVEILALLEAYVDFPDESLPIDVQGEIMLKVERFCSDIDQHLQDKRGEKIRAGLNVAIIGAPNAGKSSLFNWLAKKEAAIISDIAGTTRDSLELMLDIGGYQVSLIDTAGLRDSSDVIEQEGIKRALLHAEDADILLAMFDVTKLPALDDETCKALTDDAIILLNKCDNYTGELPEKIVGRDIIAISVKEKQGLETMLEMLHQKVTDQMSLVDSPVFTRERHKENLLKTQDHMRRFLQVMEEDGPIELASEDIRLAAQFLGRITGKIDVDELLGAIFSRFCIGK